MKDFKITLTDRKPFTDYSKKISILGLIISIVLISAWLIFFEIQLIAFIGIVLFSWAGATRFYINKTYFIEPFFMIENDLIKYRLNEYARIKVIDCNNISLITIKESFIGFEHKNGKESKIKLGFIPLKYVKIIKSNITQLGKEKNLMIK